MSQEIVEAVREIEREKGIESGTLVAALEDALLAAYKKTPGASRHATVVLDEAGDFRDHAGRIFDENRCRSPVSASTRWSFTRGAVTVTAPAPVTTARS